MSKELDELRREYAENEAKLQQYQHRAKRLEQRRQYYEKGERQKRQHREYPKCYYPFHIITPSNISFLSCSGKKPQSIGKQYSGKYQGRSRSPVIPCS